MLLFRQMKHLPTLLAAILLLSLPATARELTSADGSKKVEAEVLRYSRDTGMVTLRLENGKRLVTSISNFSEADREFFKKMERSKAIENAVEIDFRNRPKQKVMEVNKGKRINIEKRFYENAIIVKNTSEYAMKGLSLRYWLLLEKYDDKGKEYLEVLDGTLSVPELAAEEEKEVAVPSLTLILGAVPNCKPECNHCQNAFNAASKYLRERVFGHKVEVLNAKDEVIATEVSSKRVQDHLEGPDKD